MLEKKSKTQKGQIDLHFIDENAPVKSWEYAVLVTNAKYELAQVGQLYRVPDELDRLIGNLVGWFSKTLEMIRPGRSFPRRHAIGGAQRPRRAYR